MPGQLEVIKGVISSFLKDSKEGKEGMIEWFLNGIMKEEPVTDPVLQGKS